MVVLIWNDWQIETDGTSLWFPTTGDEVGHMLVTDWQRIAELTHAGVIGRLIAMGQHWVTTPPVDS